MGEWVSEGGEPRESREIQLRVVVSTESINGAKSECVPRERASEGERERERASEGERERARERESLESLERERERASESGRERVVRAKFRRHDATSPQSCSPRRRLEKRRQDSSTRSSVKERETSKGRTKA